MRRYKIDICTCDNHAPINHLKYIPTDDGPWVLYEDHATRIAELEQQLAAAKEREAAYRNALMDAAKDFGRADMGNCCQHVIDQLNRIINAAEADHADHK